MLGADGVRDSLRCERHLDPIATQITTSGHAVHFLRLHAMRERRREDIAVRIAADAERLEYIDQYALRIRSVDDGLARRYAVDVHDLQSAGAFGQIEIVVVVLVEHHLRVEEARVISPALC